MKHFIEAEDIEIHEYKVRVGRRRTNGWTPVLYVNRMWKNARGISDAANYMGAAASSSFIMSEIKPHPTGSRW